MQLISIKEEDFAATIDDGYPYNTDMNKLAKIIIAIIALTIIATALKNYIHIPNINYIVFVPACLCFRFFSKKQSIYKEWLFSTLVAIAFYLLTYCFNLGEGFSVIFWSLIGSLITLISIWIYRYILNKNNCSHT